MTQGDETDDDRGIGHRLALGAGMLFIFVVSGAAMYCFYSGMWDDPQEPASFLNTVAHVVSGELQLALFTYSGLSLLWAVATPRWVKRVMDKAETRAWKWIGIMILLAIVYAWFS